jgi:hypothetical protein
MKWKSSRRQADQKFKEVEVKKGRAKLRLRKTLTLFGAWKKKKKYEFPKKPTKGKSAGEAFQEWLDQVRKKHNQQMNEVQRRKRRFVIVQSVPKSSMNEVSYSGGDAGEKKGC